MNPTLNKAVFPVYRCLPFNSNHLRKKLFFRKNQKVRKIFYGFSATQPGIRAAIDMRSFFDFGGRNVIFIFYKGMKTVALCGNELDSRLLQTYLSSTLKTLIVVSKKILLLELRTTECLFLHQTINYQLLFRMRSNNPILYFQYLRH